MTQADPAAPALHPWTEGLALGLLRYQRCEDCDAAQTLTRFACVACGGARLAWRESAGAGTVFAATVVARAPSDAFRALAPYTIVLVDLDEGCRVMGHGAAGATIGDRVQARFVSHGALRLVTFDANGDRR